MKTSDELFKEIALDEIKMDFGGMNVIVTMAELRKIVDQNRPQSRGITETDVSWAAKVTGTILLQDAVHPNKDQAISEVAKLIQMIGLKENRISPLWLARVGSAKKAAELIQDGIFEEYTKDAQENEFQKEMLAAAKRAVDKHREGK